MLESYTPKTYWASFAVIATLSFLSLFFFGRFLIFSSEFLESRTTQGFRWARDSWRRASNQKGDRTRKQI